MEKEWQPTPVLSAGKYHGQMETVGYSPWGCQRVRHDLETKQQHANSRHANIYFPETSTGFTWHFIQIHVCIPWGKKVGVVLFNFIWNQNYFSKFRKSIFTNFPKHPMPGVQNCKHINTKAMCPGKKSKY